MNTRPESQAAKANDTQVPRRQIRPRKLDIDDNFVDGREEECETQTVQRSSQESDSVADLDIDDTNENEQETTDESKSVADDGDEEVSDDDDDDLLNTFALNRTGAPTASHLQSCKGRVRRGIFVPDWAMLVTPNDAEQKLLGWIDYWLGYGKAWRFRAKRNLLYYEHNCPHPFLQCSARFIGLGIKKDKRAVYRLIARLGNPERPLLIVKHLEHRFYGKVFALKINWPLIDRIYEELADEIESDGQE